MIRVSQLLRNSVPMPHGQIEKCFEIADSAERGFPASPNLVEIGAGRNHLRRANQRREKPIHLLKVHRVFLWKAAEDFLQAVIIRLTQRLVE